MRHLLTISLTTLAIGCQDTSTNPSSTKDLAYPGSSVTQNHLIFRTGDMMNMSSCPKSELPVRENCTKRFSADISAVSAMFKKEITNEQQPLLTRLNEEMTKEREKHPETLEALEKIELIKEELKDNNEYLSEIKQDINETNDLIQDAETRLADMDDQMEHVNHQLLASPSSQELLALKSRLLEEQREELVSKTTYLSTLNAQTSLQNSTLANIRLSKTKLLDQTKKLFTLTNSLNVSSPTIAGLNGSINHLNAQQLCWQSIADAIKMDDVSVRAMDFGPTCLQASQRLISIMKILAQRTQLPFVETFSTSSLPNGKWTYYTSGQAYMKQYYGQLRMDTRSSYYRYHSLNEAILKLNLVGYDRLSLRFFHDEYREVDESLPSSFSGHYNGDGVSISIDGVKWYRIINAHELINGYNTVNLTSEILRIKSQFGVDFDLSHTLQIKFQQHYYGRYSDRRDWDNIRVYSH